MRHATHYSKPLEQRQSVFIPCRFISFAQADRAMSIQYHSHPMDGSYLLSRRMAQHLLLQELRVLQPDRSFLRGVYHFRLLRPALPLYRPGFAFAEGIFPQD